MIKHTERDTTALSRYSLQPSLHGQTTKPTQLQSLQASLLRAWHHEGNKNTGTPFFLSHARQSGALHVLVIDSAKFSASVFLAK